MTCTELVFVPAPSIGHISPMVEFAKCLLSRDQSLSITIIIIKRPFESSTNSFANELAISNPCIKFIKLPLLSYLPPQHNNIESPEKQFSFFIESHKTLVKDAITSHVLQDSSVSFGGIVVDLFCSSMIDVALELCVPSYMFSTFSAAFLAFLFFLTIHNIETDAEFNHSDRDFNIQGFSYPVPTSALPSFCFNKDGYQSFLSHSTRMKQTKGIFLNTFLDLESVMIESLKSIPETPNIYTVGPILNRDNQKKQDSKSNHEHILTWLGDQPNSSVVFLCFGTLGSFDKPQLAQIAIALENSGHRFLWSIRQQLSSAQYAEPGEYDDFSEAVPEGFLERTKNRGMVCGWAPQVEILGHEAIGCFVSHCGWNSILESMWHGVPIVAWPLYAEQKLNAFVLEKELGLALEVSNDLDCSFENCDDQKLVIGAEKIEKCIKSVMDEENPLRKRVKDTRERSRIAVEGGGASFISFDALIQHISTNKHRLP